MPKVSIENCRISQVDAGDGHFMYALTEIRAQGIEPKSSTAAESYAAALITITSCH